MKKDAYVEREAHPMEGRQILFAMARKRLDERRWRTAANREWLLAKLEQFNLQNVATLASAIPLVMRLGDSTLPRASPAFLERANHELACGFFAGAFAMARRFERSLFNAPISLPSATRIDRRLLAGSTVFGMGWGLAGFCPGPALVSAGGGQFEAMLFVIAMLVGMKLFALAERRAARTQPS
ncbi:YeeE/YedE family protein [Burkholderia gladioli]|uniref:YeeE/YedE family protein n=1 Tax=Burkholderia gladioli TaxID=28095 RepID=UPI000A533E68|nr:YeeE/YedE family protein [Burkholderia gladioli]